MTCHTKEQLEEMLFDVVNELDLSDTMIDKHGPNGTPPAQLVREVLAQKDLQIRLLQRGFVDVSVPPIPHSVSDNLLPIEVEELIRWHAMCAGIAEQTDDFGGARMHRYRLRYWRELQQRRKG